MDTKSRAKFDQMEISGYLPELRSIVSSCCVAFWWHGTDPSGQYRILHNGTVCFLDTGEKLIAVTAGHVYQKYLEDKQAHHDLVCQFGSTTIEPEKRLITLSKELDLATFEVSTVVVGATGASPHAPLTWPTSPITKHEVLIYGGHPGILRVERQQTADLPFQWFAGPSLSVTPENIKMHLDLDNFHHILNGAECPNHDLGGMSGGPVFRHIAAPIERIELVGFIYEFQENLELVYARPAQCIRSDGTIDCSAAV